MIKTFYAKGGNKVQEGSKQKNKAQSEISQGNIRNNVRKYYLTEKVIDAWNKLPADVVGK